jgi:hypothetical protein
MDRELRESDLKSVCRAVGERTFLYVCDWGRHWAMKRPLHEFGYFSIFFPLAIWLHLFNNVQLNE